MHSPVYSEEKSRVSAFSISQSQILHCEKKLSSVIFKVTDDILRYLALQRRHSLENSLKIWVISGISERWSNLDILKPASGLQRVGHDSATFTFSLNENTQGVIK